MPMLSYVIRRHDLYHDYGVLAWREAVLFQLTTSVTMALSRDDPDAPPAEVLPGRHAVRRPAAGRRGPQRRRGGQAPGVDGGRPAPRDPRRGRGGLLRPIRTPPRPGHPGTR